MSQYQVVHSAGDENEDDEVSALVEENQGRAGKRAFNPETLRIIAYLAFWIMAGTAKVVTDLTVDEDKITNSSLVATFGYNNICVYWDYVPPMYITAMIYPAVEFPLLCYVGLNWLRTRRSYLVEHVSATHYYISTVLSVIQFVLFSWFRMIFVVRAFENVGGHTAPFTGFQLALTLNAIQNLLFYGYSENHTKVFDGFQRFVGKLYLGCVIIITVMKQTISWLAICKASSLAGFCHSYALDISQESNRTFAQTLDRLWLVFLAVIPLFLAMYTRSKSVSLDFDVTVVGAGVRKSHFC